MNTAVTLTHSKNRKRIIFQCICLILCLSCMTMIAFADEGEGEGGDPIAAVSNFSDFLFSIIRVVGIVITGWGLVQVGLSIQSHDPSQRSNGVLSLVGGIIIIFVKEIINIITG